MTGKSKKIDSIPFGIDGDTSRGLGRVNQEGDLSDNPFNHTNILQGATHIGRVIHGHEGRVLPETLLQRVQIQKSLAIAGDNIHRNMPFLSHELQGSQYGVVIHGGGYHVVTFFQKPQQDRVNSLCHVQ